MPLTWKPPSAVSTLASVIVPDHMAHQMARSQYRSLLESRIAKMAAAATWDDLLLLNLATAEGVDLADLEPDQVAEVLMRESEALAIALGLSEVTWPVKPVPISTRAMSRIKGVDLGTFLTVLYPRQD